MGSAYGGKLTVGRDRGRIVYSWDTLPSATSVGVFRLLLLCRRKSFGAPLTMSSDAPFASLASWFCKFLSVLADDTAGE